MDYLGLLELFCATVNLIQFLTGILDMQKMQTTGITTHVPYVTFLLSALSCTELVHYGLLADDTVTMLLSVAGMILNWVYVLMYLYAVKSKSQPMSYFTASVASLAGLYYYMYTIEADDKLKEDLVGGAGRYLCGIAVSLPVFEVFQRTQNPGDAPLIILGLFCYGSWTTLGLMAGDSKIYGPFLPGVAATLVYLYSIKGLSSEAAAAAADTQNGNVTEKGSANNNISDAADPDSPIPDDGDQDSGPNELTSDDGLRRRRTEL